MTQTITCFFFNILRKICAFEAFDSLGESDTIKLLELNDEETTFLKHYFHTGHPFYSFN